ncbi:MAG TPA: OB-fold nucleic acid binding domain-containing protein [Candidatus Nanopelagicales bacterium]|nr:OB-fold nucleic acid binding domain-containing protein [Candidatus Nanopelagicales bacterium]
MSTDTGRRGLFSRWARTQSELDADTLEERASVQGATLVRDCNRGQATTIAGRLRSVTLRPVASAPAVEAELWDGTGRLTLLFLGRRRIPGITPGRSLVVTGRPIIRDGEWCMVNPRYVLKPASAE